MNWGRCSNEIPCRRFSKAYNTSLLWNDGYFRYVLNCFDNLFQIDDTSLVNIVCSVYFYIAGIPVFDCRPNPLNHALSVFLRVAFHWLVVSHIFYLPINPLSRTSIHVAVETSLPNKNNYCFCLCYPHLFMFNEYFNKKVSHICLRCTNNKG